MPKPVVIFTIGTQGDVRPCVALGQGLRRAGHHVRIATSANFAEMVGAAGLEFRPLTADFQALLESDRTLADRGLQLRAMARIFRELYAAWAVNWAQEGLAASEHAGLLIGVSNCTLLAKALSEAQGIPFAIARLQPLTPSRMVPPIVLNGSGDKLPGVMKLGAHHLLFHLVWNVMRPAINDIVRPQLGLPRYAWPGPYFPTRGSLHHTAHVINGFSQHVVPRPADWPDRSQVTGYWFVDHPQWHASEALRQFLAAGPKPVYVGFGSMVNSNAKAFTQIVMDAVKKSRQRALLALGWGALDGEDGLRDEHIFCLRHAPHDQLFPLMSAAVHHGGAGTTGAAVRAGIPSVIVPFYGDQPFWARCLNRQGVAPPAVAQKGLTADTLAAALEATQQPTMVAKASALGRAVRAEDGVGNAVSCLQAWDLLPAVASEAC